MKIDQKNIMNNSTLSVYLPHPTNASNIDTPLPGCLSVISGTDKNCPDQNTLYTKVAQKGSPNTNTIPIPSPHPSNIPNVEPSPLQTVCPMICPVLLKYPDEFISNRKVVRNSSTNPDTPPTRVSDVHDTSGMTPPFRTPCPLITRIRYSIPG